MTSMSRDDRSDVFEARIASLDERLFDAIETQSSVGDRRAWLAVQRAMRTPAGYTYLEVGSHLGGSIQQHLPDPRCRGIVSIDKRSQSQPDERGPVFHYDDNSTRRMLANLRRVAACDPGRLICIDGETRDLDPGRIPFAPDICFIDGEHTVAAASADFAFCLRVCGRNAAICFHDDWLVAGSIRSAMDQLRRQEVPFVARKLTGSTFAVFLRQCPAASDPYLRRHSSDGARWLRRQRVLAALPRCVRGGVTRRIGRLGIDLNA